MPTFPKRPAQASPNQNFRQWLIQSQRLPWWAKYFLPQNIASAVVSGPTQFLAGETGPVRITETPLAGNPPGLHIIGHTGGSQYNREEAGLFDEEPPPPIAPQHPVRPPSTPSPDETPPPIISFPSFSFNFPEPPDPKSAINRKLRLLVKRGWLPKGIQLNNLGAKPLWGWQYELINAVIASGLRGLKGTILPGVPQGASPGPEAGIFE